MNKYQRFISQNPALVAPGAEMTEMQLCRAFGIEKPDFTGMSANRVVKEANKFNLKKLAAYGNLNKHLRHRGIVIKQRTTGTVSRYYVTTSAQAVAQVASYVSRAEAQTSCARQMREGHEAATKMGLFL